MSPIQLINISNGHKNSARLAYGHMKVYIEPYKSRYCGHD